MLFAWMPDLECGIGQERLPPPNLNHQKHPPQKPTVFVSSTVEHVIYIYIFHEYFQVFHSIPWFLPVTFFPSIQKPWKASHPHQLRGTSGITTCFDGSEPGVEVKSHQIFLEDIWEWMRWWVLGDYERWTLWKIHEEIDFFKMGFCFTLQ